MSATRDPVLTGARWSSAVLCARRAVYQHQDAPAEPPPTRLERMFRRGHALGRILRDEIVAEFRAQGRRPRAEEPVAWPAADPIGTGHIDVYVPSERLVVEVVSTPDAALPAHKAVQAAGYALEHPNAEHAVVLSIDSHTFDERVYPLDLDGLEPKVREIQESVVAAIRGGELPARTCAHPGTAIMIGCPFAAHCFADWVEPELDELFGFTLAALASAEDDLADARREAKRLEAERNDLRDDLRRYVSPGDAVRDADGRTARLTSFDKRTLSLSDATAAGHSVPPHLEPFVRTTPQERWTIKQPKDAA